MLTDFYRDAEDTQYVYDWRQQQEAAMRASKGTGMSVEQVNDFVNGCKRPALLSVRRLVADMKIRLSRV